MKKRIIYIYIVFSMFFVLVSSAIEEPWYGRPAEILQSEDEFSPYRESEHFLFDVPSSYLRGQITPEQLGWYLGEMDKLYEALAEFVGGADGWLPTSRFETGDPLKVLVRCVAQKSGMSAALGRPEILYGTEFYDGYDIIQTVNAIRNGKIYWVPVHELGHVFSHKQYFSAEWLADFLMMYASIATEMMYCGQIQPGLPNEPTIESWYQREFNWQNQTGIAWHSMTIHNNYSKQGTWLNMAILNFAKDHGWGAFKRAFGSYHDGSYHYEGQWYERNREFLLDLDYYEFIDRIDYFSGVNFRTEYLEIMGWLEAVEEEFSTTEIKIKWENPLCINAVNDGVIELYNPTDTAVSTRGLYLSNDVKNRFKWQIPAVIVREGESVVVEIGGLKRVGVGFDLEAGEVLRLYDVGGMALSVI